MKLKFLFSEAKWGLWALVVSAQLLTGCGASRKKIQSNVPQDYNATTKGMNNTQARLLYIDIYKGVAIREMERTGVPASIKLAQGLLESNAGRSDLAARYNNHFGIKCHSDWQGERAYKEDDDYDPITGKLVKSCFRAYKNADESFIAHSEFLRDPRKVNRYGFLFQLDKTDYQSWANGLERAGYATAQDYSEKLIRLIEDLQLHQYDLMGSGDFVGNNGRPTKPTNGSNGSNRPKDDFDTPTNPNSSTGSMGNNSGTGSTSDNSGTSGQGTLEGQRNNIRFVRVNNGLTLEQVAGRYDVSLRKLQEYNEDLKEFDTPLREGTVVYLQKKRNSWSGEEKYHKVKDCETMFDIAQRYGIKLPNLYRKNEMREGDQPAVGEKIILRRGLFQRVDMPSLRDTFNEWRKCYQPATQTRPTYPPQPSASGTRPSQSGEFGFDISNNGQQSTSTGYQPTRPSAQPSSQPSQPSYQPSQPTYQPSQPTYQPSEPTYQPPSQPSYPTTQPSYPSSQPNNYPSSDVNSYPVETPSSTTNYPPPSRPSKPSSQPTTQPTKPRPTTPSQPTGAVQYYTVLQGETLWAISRKFNTTVDNLKQLNGLADNIIKPGQQLRIK